MTIAGDAAALLSAAQLPVDVHSSDGLVLLGQLDGHTCFAVPLDLSEQEADGLQGEHARFSDLRRNAALLRPEHGALLAYSRAMLFWQRRHRFCGDCGAATRSEETGHVRACTDSACAAKIFPRTDPAIIVLTTDPSNARCLLGRQRTWVPGMYSCLAGFVEPGESLEQAVLREVHEQSGIDIASVRYRSSQPWPFPSSLMLGFRALASSVTIERGGEELEDARWFTREDLAATTSSVATLFRPRS
ncbi:MAG: NAD+ diphosphatase [Gammaproteobacteria bacterium]|jgi:NAD+ diphosphatase